MGSGDGGCPDCKELEAHSSELTARVDELEALVRKLAAKFKTSSRNSSKPASSDSPWSKAARQRKGSGKRKPGGQPGHSKAERELRSPEEVDCVIDARPEECRGCAGELHGSDSAPLRHQVAEIPPVKLLVTETRLHALVCKGCGVTTWAKLPPGTPKGTFGPPARSHRSSADWIPPALPTLCPRTAQ